MGHGTWDMSLTTPHRGFRSGKRKSGVEKLLNKFLATHNDLKGKEKCENVQVTPNDAELAGVRRSKRPGHGQWEYEHESLRAYTSTADDCTHISVEIAL